MIGSTTTWTPSSFVYLTPRPETCIAQTMTVAPRKYHSHIENCLVFSCFRSQVEYYGGMVSKMPYAFWFKPWTLKRTAVLKMYGLDCVSWPNFCHISDAHVEETKASVGFDCGLRAPFVVSWVQKQTFFFFFTVEHNHTTQGSCILSQAFVCFSFKFLRLTCHHMFR